MTDLNRIRQLAGMPLNEAEQHTWTPSQEELAREQEDDLDARDEAAADQYDLEDKSGKNILYALDRVGIEVKPNSIYFDGDSVEMKVYPDSGDGIELSKLVSLAQSGIGSNFQISPAGDMLMIRFTPDANLSASTIAD
jgi:hypothetical protein